MSDPIGPDWASLLAPASCATGGATLNSALKPFGMFRGYQLGDTGQPAIRIEARKGDRGAAERMLSGIRELAPHMVPRLPGRLWFSVSENQSGEAAHFQMFVDQDLGGAQILKGSGDQASVVMAGTLEEAVAYVARNLSWSRSLERQMRMPPAPAVEPHVDPEEEPATGPRF